MRKIYLIMTVILVVLGIQNSVSAHQVGNRKDNSKLSKPHFQYLGGFSLCANDAEKLSKWYEKFGFKTQYHKTPHYAGYFGGFKWKEVDFHFGIIQVEPNGEFCKESSPSYGKTFRVSDFDGYLKLLEKKGLLPFHKQKDQEGRFAMFIDPEGHIVSIWGE